MSRQSEAKKRQNYNPKPDYNICSNCIHFASYIIKKENTYGTQVYYDEKNKTCTLGDFVVGKTATCSEHEFIAG